MRSLQPPVTGQLASEGRGESPLIAALAHVPGGPLAVHVSAVAELRLRIRHCARAARAHSTGFCNPYCGMAHAERRRCFFSDLE